LKVNEIFCCSVEKNFATEYATAGGIGTMKLMRECSAALTKARLIWKALLLTAVILCGQTASVLAQQKNTLMGNLVVGEVTAADEATREITIKYPGKEGPEVFSGILIDGYKLKLPDGSRRELQINEITPGIRARAFYKSEHANVNGQKKKINRIVRFELLSKDEFVRLRHQLNVPKSTIVARAENDALPSTSPIKVYVSAVYNNVQKNLLEWVAKWNRKAEASDKLEVVYHLDQAEMLIVVAAGSDTMMGVLSTDLGVGNEEFEGQWSEATLYLALKDSEGLKVLWTGISPVFSIENVAVLPKHGEAITSEVEKRLKAREKKN
jgi:hypothetical protein